MMRKLQDKESASLKKLKLKFYELEDPMENLVDAVWNNHSQEEMNIADCTDMIRTHYKWYLIGWHKTLYRVMHEIRRYKELAPFFDENVIYILNHVGDQLLNIELYELINKHLIAKKRVIKNLKNL